MNASLYAIIPVKPLGEGKSRLSEALSTRERSALNRFLLERTLQRTRSFPGVANSLVVSRSTQVLRVARAHGLETLRESSEDGLNRALEEGTRHAIRAGARALMIMPVDLPLAEGIDLRRLIRALPPGPLCALVPDRGGEGTNLLIQAPVCLLQYGFGPGSLSIHRRLARRAGLRPLIVRHPRFAFDVDLPADYAQWRAVEPCLFARGSPPGVSCGKAVPRPIPRHPNAEASRAHE